jgi:Amt family ammonium transporter
MPSAYLPLLSIIGAGLILAGWLGLSTGLHAPTAGQISSAQAGVNGVLAALAAAAAAAAYSWFTTRSLNPLMTVRGLLAGLMVAWAGAPFLPAWVMVISGLLMGSALAPLIYFFGQKLPLVDDQGTLATYGLSAGLGISLVAFFADGRSGQGWNGLGPTEYQGVAGQGVSGLITAPAFVADWPGQFQAQLLGSLALLLLVLAGGLLLYQTVKVVARSWASTGLELADPSLARRLGRSLPAETGPADEAETPETGSSFAP